MIVCAIWALWANNAEANREAELHRLGDPAGILGGKRRELLRERQTRSPRKVEAAKKRITDGDRKALAEKLLLEALKRKLETKK